MLVKRFVESEKKKDKFALVKLHFLKVDNLDDDLLVEANCLKILASAKQLRNYFGIEYCENLGNILKQFSEQLGRSIPWELKDNYSELQKDLMVCSLSKSDSEDPRKRYCYKVKHNPNNACRSEFNTDKTKKLRPALFKKLGNDTNISFCYTADSSKEKDDATIIRNFSIQS